MGLTSSDPFTSSGGQYVKLNDGRSVILRVCRADTVALDILGYNVIERLGDIVPGTVVYSESAMNMTLSDGRDPNSPFENYSFPVSAVVSDYFTGSVLDNEYGQMNVTEVFSTDLENRWVSNFMLDVEGPHDEVIRHLYETLNAKYKELTPVPDEIKVQYLDDILSEKLEKPRILLRIVSVFMLISLLISALGMFAICSYFTRQDGKSIAIKKVLGSGVRVIVRDYWVKFLILTAVASVTAVPVGYYIIGRYLDTYPFRISVGFWIFAVAVITAFVLTMVSIIGQVLSAANADPVKYLKTE